MCQTVSLGAAALTSILPIATPEQHEAPLMTPVVAATSAATAQPVVTYKPNHGSAPQLVAIDVTRAAFEEP